MCREFRHNGDDGKNYATKFYNLDAIISVGYRVKSKKATQFRQWATRVLNEFAIKGFVLDNKRLENGAYLAKEFALSEFEKYRIVQDRLFESDFDKLIKEIGK